MQLLKLLSAACIVLLVNQRATAFQQSSSSGSQIPGEKATTTSPAARGQAPAQQSPRLSADETAKKNEIIQSDRFQRARAEFNQWLSIQKVYPKEQIPKLRAAFRKKINGMTADELAQFLAQMEAKLQILMSPEADQARDWIGYYASAWAVLPAAEVKKFDIANMTPAQMQQALSDVESRRRARGQESKAFNAVREEEVQQQVAANKERDEDQEKQIEQQNENLNNTGGFGANTSNPAANNRYLYGTSPYGLRPLASPATLYEERRTLWGAPGGIGMLVR